MSADGPLPRICCLDLDTFFVSVERLFRPELVGQPVVVGARPGSRGVVAAASYEVRALGVRSGMPIATAYRLAPHAIYVPGRPGEYGAFADRVRSILERYTPLVRTASIDEFFLDLRCCEALHRRPGDPDDDATIERAVGEMRAAIQREIGLPASAGIATSRPIAKIASSSAKPAGVIMVRAGAEPAFVRPLPVRRWPGIGPVTEQRLAATGILTLGQLLAVRAGSPHAELAQAVRTVVLTPTQPEFGRDRPAFHEHDPEGLTLGSISNERTFAADVGDSQTIRDQLLALSGRVCWRARQRGVLARTVTLKLRYASFETLNRSRTIAPTSTERTVYACVGELFAGNYDPRQRVRLLGVGLSNLMPGRPQLDLFDDDRQVSSAIDAVRERFGYEAIRLGIGRRRKRSEPGPR